MMKHKTLMIVVAVILWTVAVGVLGGLVYSIYSEVKNPQPAQVQHGTYAHCEYRTVKGACGMWTTKTY